MEKVIVHVFEAKNELYIEDDITIGELSNRICNIRKLNPKNWGLDDHPRKLYEVYNTMLPSNDFVILSNYWLYHIMKVYKPISFVQIYNLLLVLVIVLCSLLFLKLFHII